MELPNPGPSELKGEESDAPVNEDLLQACPDGVILIDNAGSVTYLNPAAEALTGWQAAQATGKPLETVLPLRGPAGESPGLQHMLVTATEGETIGPLLSHALAVHSGGTIFVDVNVTPFRGLGAMLLFHPHSELEDARSRTHEQAAHDALTGLPTRMAMQDTLLAVHNAARAQQRPYTLLLLDLDRFKLINDNYGHETGDAMLRHFAQYLMSAMRDHDRLGRWGGQEFLCILPGIGRQEGARMAERLRGALSMRPFRLASRSIYTTASIGVAGYPEDGDAVEDLLRIADAALFDAKRAGRNRVQTSDNLTGTLLSMAGELERALLEDRVVPAYQPIVELATEEVVAEEALARIVGDQHDPIEAGRFMEAAVQLQLVHRIDHKLARLAMQRCSGQLLAGLEPIAHFVNISADLLRHQALVDEILGEARQQCTLCGALVGPEKPLVIEITEHELVEDVREARRILAPFLDFGLRLAIDDFGSGYGSLKYLADLPVDFLKFDGALVSRVVKEPRVRAILQGVQDMANDLGLTTIGEYIEDEATLDVLREIGVHWGQGYHFGRPQLDVVA